MFMRHGATDWNAAARYQGNTETELSDAGREQVVQNARLVEAFAPGWGDDGADWRIVSSPLVRARQSAAILACELCLTDTEVRTDPAFAELSMGRWEGLNSQQVKDEYPAERKARKRDRWGFKPVGGDSLAERHAAVRDAVEGLNSHSIIVAHAGILRIVLHVLGGEPIQRAAAAEIDHTCILIWDGAKLASYPHRTMG